MQHQFLNGKLNQTLTVAQTYADTIRLLEDQNDFFYNASRFQLVESVVYNTCGPAIIAMPTVLNMLTLPTDSNERKNYPLFRGVLRYFPAALAGIARISKLGNDKHNPGQELHHARGKSQDHADCIIRHLMDTADLLSALENGAKVSDQEVLNEVSQLAWRALAYSQELHEKFGAPLAPGAKK